MIINMKPYVSLPFNSEHVHYTLGITTKINVIDQQRSTLQLLPGYHTTIKVTPQLMEATYQFKEMQVASRNCKLPHEVDGLKLINAYTRIGCEFECATDIAISACGCMPWYFTNNFTGTPMCDNFSGYCFEEILTHEANYKKCPEKCVEDCSGMPMAIIASYLPINTNDACKRGSVFDKHFVRSLRQHFAFENYRTLITGDGQIPDLSTSMANGSLCSNFIKKFVSIIKVESPTSTITKSAREVRVTFIDQIGTVGGTLGLFTGMSILSMVEVVFFLLKFIRNLFNINEEDLSFIDKITESKSSTAQKAIARHDSSPNDCGCKVKELEENIRHYKEIFRQNEERFRKNEEDIRQLKELLLPLLTPDKQHCNKKQLDSRIFFPIHDPEKRADSQKSSNIEHGMQNEMESNTKEQNSWNSERTFFSHLVISFLLLFCLSMLLVTFLGGSQSASSENEQSNESNDTSQNTTIEDDFIESIENSTIISDCEITASGFDHWISDGMCDDVNNNARCLFDGGDCCGVNVWKQHCLKCECLDYTCTKTEDCHGNGVCDESGTCQCKNNYNKKADCSEFTCHNNADCNGNGICFNTKCNCKPGWDVKEDCYTFLCTEETHCNLHGSCEDGQCDCLVDWNILPDCSGKYYVEY